MKTLRGKTNGRFLRTVSLGFLCVAMTAGLPAQEAQQAGEAPGALHLLVGRSLVITSPVRLMRVSLADPSVADAVILSPTQIQINGKAPGAVSLVLWDENNQSQTFDLMVDLDILGISQQVREIFPEEPSR